MERECLEDLGVGGRIILKCTLQKYEGGERERERECVCVCGLHLSWSWYRQVGERVLWRQWWTFGWPGTTEFNSKKKNTAALVRCSRINWLIDWLIGKLVRGPFNPDAPRPSMSRPFVPQASLTGSLPPWCSRINSTHSEASDAGNLNVSRLTTEMKILRSRTHRTARFCCHSGRGASILLLTWQLKSRDWCRRIVRLAPKVVTQNKGDFVDVILL
jgi:hypothetical protein